MTRTISVPALVVACAMAVAAITAPGAAAETSVVTSNTGFTCVEGAGAHNTNGDCELNSSGNFGHVAIAEGVERGLKLKKLSNFQLTTKIGLATVVLDGTGAVECLNCMGHNTVGGGKMFAFGENGKLRFNGVTINTKNCAVAGGGVVVTEPMRFTTLSPTEVAFEPVPAAAGTVAEIELENKEGACPLVGTPPVPIKVTGHADGKLSGAHLTFKTGAGELSVGTQTAKLEGEATVTAGVTGEEATPVALTAS